MKARQREASPEGTRGALPVRDTSPRTPRALVSTQNPTGFHTSKFQRVRIRVPTGLRHFKFVCELIFISCKIFKILSLFRQFCKIDLKGHMFSHGGAKTRGPSHVHTMVIPKRRPVVHVLHTRPVPESGTSKKLEHSLLHNLGTKQFYRLFEKACVYNLV